MDFSLTLDRAIALALIQLFLFPTLYRLLIYMYKSKEPWMEKGFNDFYQELWYYHVVTFKRDQKEKELRAKSVEGYHCN